MEGFVPWAKKLDFILKKKGAIKGRNTRIVI
jgi:hypothetical protein